jgi:hypothetical protein
VDGDDTERHDAEWHIVVQATILIGTDDCAYASRIGGEDRRLANKYIIWDKTRRNNEDQLMSMHTHWGKQQRTAMIMTTSIPSEV